MTRVARLKTSKLRIRLIRGGGRLATDVRLWGTFRIWPDVRLESVICTEPDVRRSPPIYGFKP
jgi:hypothetical protein